MLNFPEDNAFEDKTESQQIGSNATYGQDTNVNSGSAVEQRGSADQRLSENNQVKPDPVKGTPAPKAQEATKPSVGSSLKKKPASEQITARNQANSKYARGPNDTSRTRYNAVKHGLRAAGLTRFDDAGKYFKTLDELNSQYPPRNGVETFENERAALGVARGRRMPRMEAETIEALSNPSSPSQASDFGKCCAMMDPATMITYGAPTLNLLHRYDSDNLRNLLGLYREIQRRKGESHPVNLDCSTDIDGNVTI